MKQPGVRRQAASFRDGGTAPRLVLASASPRRRELIERLGLVFEVEPAHIDEAACPGEGSAAMADRLAREKALAVAACAPDALVIGSDTIVVVDGDVLGKPVDDEEAVGMLLRLQGREHRVETGIAVAATGSGNDAPRIVSSTVTVDVRFRPFGEDFARAYVRTGEPLDKAGGYGIQGHGSALVERIEGDYFAVMGLPIVRMLEHLEELGWMYRFGPGLVHAGTRP